MWLALRIAHNEIGLGGTVPARNASASGLPLVAAALLVGVDRLEKAAKGLAGRLSTDELRRLITAGRASKTLRDWNGWLHKVIKNETWNVELGPG